MSIALNNELRGEKVREFDFWLGNWRVISHQGGQELGTSSVERVLGGNVLHEHWVGSDGSEGESFNLFDRARNCWHQSWVGADGMLLLLDGEMRGGAMDLEGTTADGARQRIRWWPQADGSVIQLWESSLDAGKTWECRFHGLYLQANQGLPARQTP
jgi:hypothetical protein